LAASVPTAVPVERAPGWSGFVPIENVIGENRARPLVSQAGRP
jgi:hypothetical protein